MNTPKRIEILFRNGITKVFNEVETITHEDETIHIICKGVYGAYHTESMIMLRRDEICYLNSFVETEPIKFS